MKVLSSALSFSVVILQLTYLTHSYQVERAIEIALANPIDFEYAIDKEVSRDFMFDCVLSLLLCLHIWRLSMFRAAYSMAEKPCATSWIKVKSRRFRNLLLKKSSSCKTSQSQSSCLLAELFSNFRLWSNWSWCCESPWQILWQREGGQGRRAFTFSRWQDLDSFSSLEPFLGNPWFAQGCIFSKIWYRGKFFFCGLCLWWAWTSKLALEML